MKLNRIALTGILTGSIAAFLTASVHADIFGSGANAFNINFVTVGNAGNGNDAGAGGGLYSSPFGGVSYTFQMGVTEVAQDWITKATNLGMTNVTAGTFSANRPATSLTWYEMAGFVNWLNTNQGHQAAYQLDGTNTSLTLWSSAQAWQAGGENLYRHKDAYYFLPSENEWYKAAHHKNDGVTANYWDYATGSNTIPMAVASGTGAGSVVYAQNFFGAGPADITQAGGLSAYGTMGQNGNALEWTESASTAPNDSSSEGRAIRGGFWGDAEGQVRSSFRSASGPQFEGTGVGFRVASIPEPSSTVLMLSAGLLALARSRRRAAL